MVYVATVTIHDGEGEALHTIRYGRVPIYGSEDLVAGMLGDVKVLLQRRPSLRVVLLTDVAVETTPKMPVPTCRRVQQRRRAPAARATFNWRQWQRRNGYEVLRELRKRGYRGGVIMLTAKGLEEDKVLGLDLGADDYVQKPFGLHELVARMHAVLRRRNAQTPLLTHFADVSVDRRARVVTKANEPVTLSPKEMSLLLFLIDHAENVSRRVRTSSVLRERTRRGARSARQVVVASDASPTRVEVARLGGRAPRRARSGC